LVAYAGRYAFKPFRLAGYCGAASDSVRKSHSAGPPPTLKPVFDYPELNHVFNFTTRFLANLAMQCFLRRLAELYSTAERPKESLALYVVVAESD
jgi:hypothetical protein